MFDFGKINILDIESIGSGIIININLLKKLNVTNYFDESYEIYGCDDSFYNFLKKQKNILCCCSGSIYHSISMFSHVNSMPMHTKLEIGYSRILERIKNKKSLIANLLFCIRLNYKYKGGLIYIFKMIKCCFKKKHPRNSITINKIISSINNKC